MVTANTLESYYAEAKRWQSELNFYQTEIRVLHQLIDKHLSAINDDAQVAQLGFLLNDLFNWTISDRLVADTLTEQLHTLPGMINDAAAFADDRCKEKQDVIRVQMSDLHAEYQQLKANIYELAGSLLQTA